MRSRSFFVVIAAVVVIALSFQTTTSAAGPQPSAGSLSVVKDGKTVGECPLRHTDVKANISGAFARVTVTQSFENNASGKIEAVYTFPLPHDAAVDDMTIQIGTRTIRGVIQTREQAEKTYKDAIQRGQTAALLDQERPNIFSQRVGNIPPGGAVDVTISYVAPLKYEDGSYEFAFPMVVGPRYIPGEFAIGRTGGGTVPDTNQVPDASKITPPVSPTRAGHDISISLAIDAGVPIQNLRSSTHSIDVKRAGANEATVALRDSSTIPNKDFVLRYDVAGSQIVEGLLTHTRTKGDGYFSLIVQPPARFPESDVTPKEIVFVLDSSGSMNGFPVDCAKRFIDTALNGLYAGDTFNVIKFSGDTAVLFKEPVYPTAENVGKAREFVNSQWGGGGTEMMKAIKAALDPSDSQDHLRIVVFLTDGYVGNDSEILAEIRTHKNARVFAFGIGSSVNRYLINGMGQQGNGDSEIVTSVMKTDEVDEASKRLYEHLRSPLLTDISLDFGSLPVTDVYPTRIADLFSGRPVVVTGRYLRGAKGSITLKGKRAGDTYTKQIAVEFPEADSDNSVLASLWARGKIEDLMSQDLAGMQQQQMKPALEKEITLLGLNYRLMTQFTSFVAVEERVSTEGGKPRTVQVPVELPEGVEYERQWEGTQVPSAGSVNAMVVTPAPAGNQRDRLQLYSAINAPPPPHPPSNGTGSGAGVGAGSGGGIGGGVYRVGGGVSQSVDVDKVQPKPEVPLTPEGKLLASKSNPKLLAVYECWSKLSDKSAADTSCKTVTGKIAIDIVVKGGDLSELKSLGFVADGQPIRGRIRGKIAIGKLPALAALKSVEFVSLAPSS